MKGLALALLLAAALPAAAAAEQEEALAWLKKMAGAARQVNYSGVFVYQHGNRIQTSRIVHYVNNAGGEFERLETLDGPPREVIRTNEQVTCYLPSARTVIIERRNARRFPSLLPEQITSAVTDSYTVRSAGKDRVAGHDCRVIVLEPRDRLRYGQQFCAEVATGLPLRARTVDDKEEVLESFAFTELKIGGRFNRDQVRSRYAARAKDWRVDRSALPVSEMVADTGWVLTNLPAGFRKLTELKRQLAGRSGTVSQIVFSDGLAAVSVFIEPLPKAPLERALWHQGAINIYVRALADHMVTVLGEAPAATLMQIADSLEYRGAGR